MTTKKFCIEKIDEMMPDITKLIKEKAVYYLNSGAIDIDGFSDNYLLPKILLSVICDDIKNQYYPYNDEKSKKVIKNLKNF